MPVPDAAVVIAARDAAATIGRAVASAVASTPAEILLVDDFSSDGTADLARRAGGDRLRVVMPPRHQSLGLVRQAALDALRTEFAVGLDADDMLLPGRVERLVSRMKSEGTDLAADGVELFSGATDRLIREIPLPPVLRSPGSAVRNFERNFLPATGPIGFRTRFARSIGYDPELLQAEDVDFFLRAVAAGGRVSFAREIGYRLYSYPDSASRNLDLQRGMLAKALRKHAYPDVARLYQDAGYSRRIAGWGLWSMALFRGEFEPALRFLDDACPLGSDPAEVLEPEGPMPVPEGWRAGFARGTLLCLLDRPAEALPCFEQAARFDGGFVGSTPGPAAAGGAAPDLLNNWGVALARTGRPADARRNFAAALDSFPGYLDARLNLGAQAPSRLTTHPLRRLPSRSEYREGA